MKKTAAILLLFIFALVQAGPVACCIFSDTDAITVFAVDEEKNPEKTGVEKKKDKNDCTFQAIFSAGTTRDNTVPPHHEATALVAVCAENSTPPPDFC